ncbi:glycosyltransferase family 2 protein [Gloeothece verrucosa]|uniref:Glycosyl transferase family 2 n=1 Tax=Gloeothece verrucosa (strain PCC 7822) TaxID=497965 RepID=E0U834_GLOV7|nr:glycosyltransferase family 2 protein [Gloeothece verrucosa]ADN17239.1 glycosyl transferase family 2 [Gloeothece verrucosa PCC 7822]
MLPISVITVTHNHAPYIARCLDALLPEVKQVGGEIILIDNRSDDESYQIASAYPDVQLYLNPERRGFAANNNFGMAVAKGRYLLLLNPDTEILPGSLNTLIQFMDENPNVGLSGAQLLFPDGSIQPSPRRFPTWGSVLARRSPLRIFLRNSGFNRRHLMLDIDHSQPFPVDWLLGACLLIRQEVLETVGPLDEGFFLYVEDIDWARRIHQQGWKVYYIPTAQIIHHHLAVSDKHFFSYRMWLHFQSMIRYTRKYLVPKLPLLSIRGNQTKIWKSTHKEMVFNKQSEVRSQESEIRINCWEF